MRLSHKLFSMNNDHSLTQYSFPDDDDWNIMVSRCHSTNTTSILHDFHNETTTVWNFVIRRVDTTYWMTNRTFDHRWISTLSRRNTKRESSTANIALSSLRWLDSFTRCTFTTQVECISPPAHQKPGVFRREWSRFPIRPQTSSQATQAKWGHQWSTCHLLTAEVCWRSIQDKRTDCQLNAMHLRRQPQAQHSTLTLWYQPWHLPIGHLYCIRNPHYCTFCSFR